MKTIRLLLRCSLAGFALCLGFAAESGPKSQTNTGGKFLPALSSIFKGTNSSALAALSEDQVVQGLRQALDNGLQQAIRTLGRTNGFLTNAQVRIPMPEQLEKVETTLRKLKQDQLADEFVTTMNRAAEQAVPQAASVFADAVKQLTIADAKAILTGPDDAATRFFRRTTETNLQARFRPIVQKATESAGATAAFKNIVEQTKALSKKTGGLRSLGTALGFNTPDPAALDLDGYVTEEALEGLFKMVAAEEKAIRQNPQARTTELLQKVFGAVKK